MVYLALELVGPWVVLGFSVGLEAFDELLSINSGTARWKQRTGQGMWEGVGASMLSECYNLSLMNDQTMVYFELLGSLVAVAGVVRCPHLQSS